MQRDLGNPFVLLSFSYARCVVILLFPYRLAFISEFCCEFILSSVCLNYMNWVCFFVSHLFGIWGPLFPRAQY